MGQKTVVTSPYFAMCTLPVDDLGTHTRISGYGFDDFTMILSNTFTEAAVGTGTILQTPAYLQLSTGVNASSSAKFHLYCMVQQVTEQTSVKWIRQLF